MRNKSTHRILVACSLILLGLSTWPGMALVNRIEPFVFGLPLFVFAMLIVNLLVAVILFAFYQISE